MDGVRERFGAAESEVLAAFGVAATSRFIDLPRSGRRVRILESGKGQTVLVLPGLGAVASFWAPLMAELPDLRLVALDRPGCGLSDPFDLRGDDVRTWLVKLIEELREALGGGRISLIGNSIGGTAALWYAMAHPEGVDRVVLIGAPPYVLDHQAPLPMRILSIPAIARRALKASSEKDVDVLFQRMGHRSGALSPELVRLVLAARTLPGYADGYIGVLHGTTTLFGRRVSAPAAELARLKTPTLLIWGDGDTHGSVETGRRMVATMPNASLEVRGQGHLPWIDEPVACGKLIAGFFQNGEDVAAHRSGARDVRP